MIPDECLDWRTKGFWLPSGTVSLREFAAARHPLFGGPFTWPIMVARRSALDHNIAALADFCTRHGLEFAPHGKTSMAPSLFEAQLRAGAWGITAATANQLLAYRAFGVPRVLLANELLEPNALGWLAEEIERGWDVLLYADSAEGVAALSAASRSRPFQVLLELGHPAGRTGCRDIAGLVELGRAVAAAPGVVLAGVACYEGNLSDAERAAAFLDTLRSGAAELSRAGLLPPTVIVSAGGSAYFDVVAERLAGSRLPGHAVRVILRSGAYVTHDDGLYARKTPFTRVPGSLDAALEIWAQVLSVPEPGLAIAGLGRREAPHDADLPVPLRVRRADGTVRPADGLHVTALNDHHAYVAGSGPRPGDLICFGISHPCTAFDKWEVIPVVDDSYTVVDLLRTYF
jgi:D-serine deaminase-like pyridoxal phosphate-dependent protein